MTVAIRIEAVQDLARAQAVIDRWLGSLDGGPAAVLFEAPLKIHRLLRPLPAAVEAVELALGCPCCTGALALRVTLVRVAQRLKPTGLLLLLTRAEHAARLKALVRSGELGSGLRLI
jgi:hypothetical protein